MSGNNFRFIYLEILKHLFSHERSKHCASDEEVKTAMMQWLWELSAEFYESAIYALIWRWNIAIEKNGDYVKE